MDHPQQHRCLESKVALITGAGRGIGRATAQIFARAGARVVLCSRTKHELSEVVRTITSEGGEATARVVDIGIAKEANALARLALTAYGHLDIVINNAGILGPRVPLLEYPHRDWTQVLRINLHGTFYVSQAAATIMVRQGSGCIISVSSSVGRKGRAQWGAYAVSKFGVEGLSQTMADELRSSGVCIVTFNPGGTRTGMREEAYPEEDPSSVPAPEKAAFALLRIASCASPGLSGRAFDLSNLP